MIIVSDTTPFRSLIEIDVIDILATLFALLIPVFLLTGVLVAVTGLLWLCCRATVRQFSHA